jgi:hypothetical protein
MQGETWYLLATLGAILLGPILAVLITRFNDSRSEKRNRQVSVFRNLMQTRGTRLDPLHVSSLNLIDVEFYHDSAVRTAFRAYMEHLSAPMPVVTEQDRFFERRHDLFLTLLASIGKCVGYYFDKHDLDRLSYSPEGWNSDQVLQRRNTTMLSELLSGQRSLPVSAFAPANNPFPSPPEIEQA